MNPQGGVKCDKMKQGVVVVKIDEIEGFGEIEGSDEFVEFMESGPRASNPMKNNLRKLITIIQTFKSCLAAFEGVVCPRVRRDLFDRRRADCDDLRDAIRFLRETNYTFTFGVCTFLQELEDRLIPAPGGAARFEVVYDGARREPLPKGEVTLTTLQTFSKFDKLAAEIFEQKLHRAGEENRSKEAKLRRQVEEYRINVKTQRLSEVGLRHAVEDLLRAETAHSREAQEFSRTKEVHRRLVERHYNNDVKAFRLAEKKLQHDKDELQRDVEAFRLAEKKFQLDKDALQRDVKEFRLAEKKPPSAKVEPQRDVEMGKKKNRKNKKSGGSAASVESSQAQASSPRGFELSTSATSFTPAKQIQSAASSTPAGEIQRAVEEHQPAAGNGAQASLCTTSRPSPNASAPSSAPAGRGRNQGAVPYSAPHIQSVSVLHPASHLQLVYFPQQALPQQFSPQQASHHQSDFYAYPPSHPQSGFHAPSHPQSVIHVHPASHPQSKMYFSGPPPPFAMNMLNGESSVMQSPVYGRQGQGPQQQRRSPG